MKRINGCNSTVTSTADINPMLHLQSPQFLPLPLPLPLPTSRRLRRSSLLCPGAGDSLRKLPESCYSYGSPVLRRSETIVAFVGKDETEVRVPAAEEEEDGGGDEVAGAKDADPRDLEYVRQIQRVLELLKKNRDMIFSEVRLTIMIEDAREVERRKLLGIEDPDAPTRDDLVVALEQVNEGKIPENRIALRMLAEEMNQWPSLEVETTKKKPSKSLYAKATDTGVDLKTAAKRLNIDWDTAAEIEDEGLSQETEVPPALGYGALYLVTAFPVIIGISVVLILFYNSLR